MNLIVIKGKKYGVHNAKKWIYDIIEKASNF